MRAPSVVRRGSLAILTVIVAIVVVVWHHSRGNPAIGVVLITLDTTRADRLTPYGLMDVPMPALERLAADGLVFDQAMSVAPLTLPAHASLFTGLFPPAHGVRDNSDASLAGEHVTLAEVLHAQGVRTGAFVGSYILDSRRGLAQGFDTYRGPVSPEDGGPRTGQRRADEVITEATAWLEHVVPARFFLWAHLYDPHRPYDPPEPYRSRFIDPYIGEIAFVDAQIEHLLDALETRGVLDRTIVIVAGDHGESLGDHGERDHGIFIYENVLRVPLIIRAPGFAPARIGSVVRLVDVMATALDLIGVAAPASQGVSLRKLMTGETADLELDAYAESLYPMRFGLSSLRSLRQGQFKFIEAPGPELYDLERDPFEEMNLFNERPGTAGKMARRLQALAGELDSAAASVSTELMQGISALGYVSTSPAGDPRGPLPDPKDCMRDGLPRSVTAGCQPGGRR